MPSRTSEQPQKGQIGLFMAPPSRAGVGKYGKRGECQRGAGKAEHCDEGHAANQRGECG